MLCFNRSTRAPFIKNIGICNSLVLFTINQSMFTYQIKFFPAVINLRNSWNVFVLLIDDWRFRNQAVAGCYISREAFVNLRGLKQINFRPVESYWMMFHNQIICLSLIVDSNVLFEPDLGCYHLLVETLTQGSFQVPSSSACLFLLFTVAFLNRGALQRHSKDSDGRAGVCVVAGRETHLDVCWC